MGFYRASALLLACLNMTGQALAQGREPDLVLRVLVYDYAEVPDATLRSAQRHAGRIFQKAGVAFEWRTCRIASSQQRKGPGCSGAEGRTDLFLKILPKPRTPVRGADQDVAGFVPSGEMVSDAYVFYDRLYDMARQEAADVAVLLGLIIAHEFGHLLAGPGSHSANGVMRSEWTARSLARAPLSGREFSLEQNQRIRMGALLRLQAAEGL